MKKSGRKTYHRYLIETKKSPNIVKYPNRFKVIVNRLGLTKLLLKELFYYRGNREVILSRPCVYGVFSGPLGGFAPREHLCVGCLRCTTEYPDFVQILRNPERDLMGDDYFLPEYVHTVIYEAESGRVPVKGMGYRGKFGGEGWDGMWTDMSEIVRPTRDGIHGREFISTEVDIGRKPPFLELDEQYQPFGILPQTITIPIPLIFDSIRMPSSSAEVCSHIFSESAKNLQSFAILPLDDILKYSLKGHHLIPCVGPNDLTNIKALDFHPSLIEISFWSGSLYREIQSDFPKAMIILRSDFNTDEIMAAYKAGVRIFHLTANYHGKGKTNEFVLDMIRKAHMSFVKMDCRDEVTLIGSGGIIAAEHMPKAIICGLDAIAMDTPLVIALQGKFIGKCLIRSESSFQFPSALTVEWGKQRLKNLIGSWRDQLLEVLGAMGIREVRRLRGEVGRAMFQKDLEKEAFAGIAGYEAR